MTTFSATADSLGRFVTLVVSGVTADSVVTITRTPSPGGITVRGTPVELAASGATVLTDLEFPYGETITYTAVLRDPTSGATLETLTDTAGPVTLSVSGMVVSDPLTNRQVLLTIQDQTEEQSEFRGFRYDLAGRSHPLFLLEEHAGWRWVNVWLTHDQTERQTLDDLLRHRAPVLLRITAGCDLNEGWVVPQNIRRDRLGVPGDDSRRRWTVEVSQVDAPGSDIEGVAVTLDDLHDYEPGDLQDLADRAPTTLLELSLAVIDDA